MKETMLNMAIGVFGGLGGFALIMLLIKKFGPGLWAKLGAMLMSKVVDYDEGDPQVNEARKKMVLAIMVYLEVKLPDRGQGPERKARLIQLLGEKAGPMADELLCQLDDELKKLTHDPA